MASFGPFVLGRSRCCSREAWRIASQSMAVGATSMGAGGVPRGEISKLERCAGEPIRHRASNDSRTLGRARREVNRMRATLPVLCANTEHLALTESPPYPRLATPWTLSRIAEVIVDREGTMTSGVRSVHASRWDMTKVEAVATAGMVSAGHRLAAEAGVEMLRATRWTPRSPLHGPLASWSRG